MLLTHSKDTKVRERERDRQKEERDRENVCAINTLRCVNNNTLNKWNENDISVTHFHNDDLIFEHYGVL